MPHMDASLPAAAKKAKVTRSRKSAHTGKIRIGKASATEIRATLGITRAEAQVAERAIRVALGRKAVLEAMRGNASKKR